MPEKNDSQEVEETEAVREKENVTQVWKTSGDRRHIRCVMKCGASRWRAVEKLFYHTRTLCLREKSNPQQCHVETQQYCVVSFFCVWHKAKTSQFSWKPHPWTRDTCHVPIRGRLLQEGASGHFRRQLLILASPTFVHVGMACLRTAVARYVLCTFWLIKWNTLNQCEH